MKKVLILLGCFSLFALFSCSKDMDEFETNVSSTKYVSSTNEELLSSEVSGTSIITNESLFFDNIPQAKYNQINSDNVFRSGQDIYTRSSNNNSYNITMTANGYSNITIAAVKTKCLYNSSSPIVQCVGLAGGIYFVEVVKVNKNLSTNKAGDIVNPITPNTEDKDMGTKTCGFFETTIGWTADGVIETGDKSFIGTTYLIHFLYTMGGAKIDRYYPCRPEDIVWKYQSIEYDLSN